MTAKRRTNHDITRTFQEISIQGWEPAKPTQPAGADLNLVQVDRPEAATGSLQPANVEQSLEELVALLQRRTQEN